VDSKKTLTFSGIQRVKPAVHTETAIPKLANLKESWRPY
jgi:hypothetical protein